MPDLDRYLDGTTLILLSNREPYEHVAEDGRITVRQPAGGLVSALDPTMRRTHGIWVAWGSGSGDRAATPGDCRVPVPPDDPSYTLHRVWLDEEDIEGYYLGFANRALWPLCHLLIQHFEFRAEHWERYRSVNARFAQAVASELRHARHRPVVWIQDYHFALVPQYLREAIPDVFVHQFWHIPFPPPDILRLLPIGVLDSVLRGMLGNDLIEFHTARYASNFIDCVREFLPDARPYGESLTVRLGARTIHTGAFPISIDVERFEELASSEEGERCARELRERYATGTRALGVSVDRIDYTKGIPQRLDALETLWDESPELRGRFTMLVVATPSRSEIPAYSELEQSVVERVDAINRRIGDDDWTPIVLVRENADAGFLAAIYRAADLCLVSSLQDGMNLVAKEFVACQLDERGVLLLSRFTGAAEEIEGATLINPFNVDGFVAAIRAAIEMPCEERQRRMRAMRAQLRDSTIFDWLESILSRCALLMESDQSLGHEPVRPRRAADELGPPARSPYAPGESRP
jgi:trehalose 6-phosphate synthase